MRDKFFVPLASPAREWSVKRNGVSKVGHFPPLIEGAGGETMAGLEK